METEGDETLEAPEGAAPLDAADDASALEGDVEEATAESDSGIEVDYSSMTVVQLKVILKEAGKPVSGKKDDLIARLNE